MRDHIYVVFTGDLVGSTGLPLHELHRARDIVLDAIRELSRWSDGLVVGEAEFFRGDSWQLLLREPRLFLRAALYLRATLRSEGRDLDTRIGIGFGTVEKIERNRISLSVGDAFTASGRQLDAMSDAVGLSVQPPFGPNARLGWLDPLAALCSATMNSWSERQADIALRMLEPGNRRQVDIASDLSITKQSVSKTLGAIDFNAILSAIRWIEESEWEAAFHKPNVRLV